MHVGEVPSWKRLEEVKNVSIFFTSRQPNLPTVTAAFEEALSVDPKSLTDIKKEAAHRTIQLSNDTSRQFNGWRFGGAIMIALALLLGAIWTGQHNLPDISKALMDSFSGFSGLTLGLLGGEAQK
jgi:hypothetical protein